MRIERVGLRDPDGGTDVTVFVDGAEASPDRVVIADPGSGWDDDDWQRARADAVDSLSPAAGRLARELFDAATPI